ncbi:unnamed protein product [Bubo scandiacus]
MGPAAGAEAPAGSALSAPRLVAAAREELGAGAGRRRLPAARALQLAGEVLAVAAGLKPALLYDCGAAGPAELRRYLARLREAGLAPRRLHAAEATSAGPVSSSEVVPAGWNLCTIVGVLLGYPAAYTFAVEEGAQNCLALTPLRVFTAQASCPSIRDGLRVQIYSFSIPESLCAELKEVLDAWCDELKEAFSAQSDFVDLRISSEVVSLPAVAL